MIIMMMMVMIVIKMMLMMLWMMLVVVVMIGIRPTTRVHACCKYVMGRVGIYSKE